MASKTFDQLTDLAAAPSIGDWFALVDTTAGSTKKLDAKYLVVATAGAVTNVTGGGTIALGGFTATIPATGTAALLATANTFTAAQTIDIGYKLLLNPNESTAYFGLVSANDLYGFTQLYDGDLHYYRHENSVPGDQYMTVKRANGNVLVGTTTDVTSAKLQIGGTTGALLLSRLTTTQRDALTPTNGMVLYNSTLGKFQGYEAGAWANLI